MSCPDTCSMIYLYSPAILSLASLSLIFGDIQSSFATDSVSLLKADALFLLASVVIPNRFSKSVIDFLTRTLTRMMPRMTHFIPRLIAMAYPLISLIFALWYVNLIWFKLDKNAALGRQTSVVSQVRGLRMFLFFFVNVGQLYTITTDVMKLQ